MLVVTNKSAPKRLKSAPRSSPHTPTPRCGALAHRPRCSAPMFKMAHIGAHWRALAQETWGTTSIANIVLMFFLPTKNGKGFA